MCHTNDSGGVTPFSSPNHQKGETMKHAYIGYIPSNVRYDNLLSCREKLLYCEITATLDNGYCTKTNLYFSKALGYSQSSVSKYLGTLRECGHINLNLIRDEVTMKYKSRLIWLTAPRYEEVEKNKINDTTTPQTEVDQDKKKRSVVFNHDQSPISTTAPHDIYYYTNNIIHSKSNKNPLEIKLLRDINEKQYEYLYRIVRQFYNKQSRVHSKLVSKYWSQDKNLVNESINNLFKLIKVDKFEDTEVWSVIEWATYNDFWSKNLLSLRSLRKKSKNGLTKFANIYSKWSSE